MKPFVRALVFAASSWVLPSFAVGASFDCAKAVTRIENAICASAVLSQLDVELSRLYQDALLATQDIAENREEVKAAQRAWIQKTRNGCSDEACLKTVYSQRMAALKAARQERDQVKADIEAEEKAEAAHQTEAQGTQAVAPMAPPAETTSNPDAPKPAASATQPGPASSSVAAVSPASAAAVMPASTPSKNVGSEISVEPSMGAMSNISLALAFLLPIPIAWFSYKKLRSKKQPIPAIALSVVAGGAAFLAFAIAGDAATTREYKEWAAAAKEKKVLSQMAAHSHQQEQRQLADANAKTNQKAVTGEPQPLPMFKAFERMRYGATANLGPEWIRRARNETWTLIEQQIKGRPAYCLTKKNPESGIDNVSLESATACFDEETNKLVSVWVLISEPKYRDAGDMKLMRLVAAMVGNRPGLYDQTDFKAAGNLKAEWKRLSGKLEVEVGYSSIPGGITITEDSPERYISGMLPTFPMRTGWVTTNQIDSDMKAPLNAIQMRLQAIGYAVSRKANLACNSALNIFRDDMTTEEVSTIMQRARSQGCQFPSMNGELAAHRPNEPVRHVEEADPFPYTATLSCQYGQASVSIESCFASHGLNSELELRNGDDYKLLTAFDIGRHFQKYSNALIIPLRKNFEIKAQNSADSMILMLKIQDKATGEVFFQKAAGRFGVIEVRS